MRVAANSFVGSGHNRYMNPEFDALIDRFFSTVSRPERIWVLRDIVHHMSDRVLAIGLFYDTEATLIGKRIEHLTGRYQNSTQSWNAHLWDTRG